MPAPQAATTCGRTVGAAGVLAATERLLAGGVSFTELTMQAIATEANSARSTIYLYFGEKGALLIQMAGALSAGAYAITSSWSPRSPSGLDGLAETMGRVIHYYRDHAPVLTAIREASGYDRAVREFWDAEVDKFVSLSQEWMRAEQEAGRAPADRDGVTASRMTVHGGRRAIADHVATGDPEQDHAVAREIAVTQWFGTLRRPAVTE